MRSYIEKRNALILALSKFVGCPVLMASQVEPGNGAALHCVLHHF